MGIQLLKLTHANLNQTMFVPRALIAAWYHSPGHKCTHVVASGGAVFPALESVDEVKRLYETAGMTPVQPKEESQNGIQEETQR